MIKRPLNARFPDKVRAGVKVTTIRENPWPVGVPIMLYCWSGKPYRSKQSDVCTVVVEEVAAITIGRWPDGVMRYEVHRPALLRGRELWSCEGFRSQDDMDDWFRGKMKPGQCVTKALMRFRLAGNDERD